MKAALERKELPDVMRRRATFFLAAGLFEQGRIREARKVFGPFDAAKQLDAITRVTNVPMYELPRAELLALREQVLRLDSIGGSNTPDRQLAPQLPLYNLAVLSCRPREYPAAATYAQRLRQLPVRAEWQDAVHALATEVSAQIDIENGRAQISDVQGRHEDARLKYAKFVKLFEKADPEMQSIVTQARNRLAELQREAG